MRRIIIYSVCALFGLFLVFVCVTHEQTIVRQTNEIQNLKKTVIDLKRAIVVKDQPYIPDSIQFFGGRVPLEYYGVWDDIDFWIRYYVNPKNRWRVLVYLEKKETHFPVIGTIIKQKNIPLDARFVSVAESEMNPTIVSKAGAKGFWQFMFSTAKHNALIINGQMDERMNIERATEGACKELGSLQKEFAQFGLFNSWMFALAGYNAGPGSVWRAIKKDNERSYFLLSSLPKETQEYIPRIIALKLILENPERYGFIRGVTFGGPKIKLVKHSAKKFESWNQLGKTFGISGKEMRRANPFILNKEGVARGEYVLRVPDRK